MKKQTVLLTTVIIGLLSFSGVSQAEPSSGHKGGHAKYSQMSDADKSARMQKRLDRMATKLGLSDAQKTQIQALKLNSRNDMKPLRDEKRAIRQEMKTLDTSAPDYSTRLADIANRKSEIARQMTIVKGNKRQQLEAILTPEQLAKMKTMRSKRKGSHKRKHKRHN